jgi:hypothetical protein
MEIVIAQQDELFNGLGPAGGGDYPTNGGYVSSLIEELRQLGIRVPFVNAKKPSTNSQTMLADALSVTPSITCQLR